MMKQNKSEIIRFEMLKILKNTNTHGYNLFLLLSERGLVRDVSECYKVIRSLKEADLIRELVASNTVTYQNRNGTNQGSSKKTLEITQKGIHAYYEWIFSSMLVFFDFIEEIRQPRISDEIKMYLSESGIEYDNIIRKTLLFSFQNLPARLQEGIILKFLLPLAEGNAIYYQSMTEISEDTMKILLLKAPHLTVLTENLTVNKNSVDMIFAFNITSPELLENTVDRWKNLLKKEGQLLLSIPKYHRRHFRFRPAGEDPQTSDAYDEQINWQESRTLDNDNSQNGPQPAREMINMFLEEIPENLRMEYVQKIPTFSRMWNLEPSIEISVLIDTLQKNFPTVTPCVEKNNFTYVASIKN